MKIFVPLIFFFLLLPLSCMAQGRIAGPSPSSKDALDLYGQPGDPSPIKAVKVGELVFPMEIRESRAGFHQIVVAGQSFWVRGAHVRIQRQSTAGCDSGEDRAVVSKTMSMPGVVNNSCK